MPLPMPNLDDRRFQDIVDEAKRMIPLYCPEWTDHNVSDPGVTLIELFAWMVEMLIFRLNRVPEKSLITFMELMGVHLQPPAPARVDLTFWLSAPPGEPVIIPAGTAVATAQTATEPAVSFTTDTDLLIHPPKLLACYTSPNERVFDDQTWKLDVENETFLAFSPKPRPGDALYLGYEKDFSGNILALEIDCSVEGIGVDPTNPPLSWEVWCVDGWVEAELDRDGTGGLNKRGQVVLYVPNGLTPREINGKTAYWVRCQYITPEVQQSAYTASPVIQTIQSSTLGGTVNATHCTPIVEAIVGRSDGAPGQRFRLDYAPVLPRQAGERIEVQREDESWEPWTEVENFGKSRPEDKHYQLDSVSGEISFGPAIREPDGTTKQYGAIPPRGRLIRFSRYRTGGGSLGNVGAGTIRMLQSTVSYVDRVVNRRPATGGRDAETLERAKLRAPQMLRTMFRAVTAEDYEYLAMEASPSIARARCLQPRAADDPDAPSPGTVQLLLVPSISNPEGRIEIDQLRLAPRLVEDVRRYIDHRRLLTTIVTISEPEYRWVSVEARLKARMDADPESVRREVAGRLYRFLNPLVGGAQGTGWPFGRSLYTAEIYALLQGVAGIEYIEQVSLNLLVDGKLSPQQHISVPPNGLIASAEHQIIVI
ncbi:MAG: putative baseplate assembly protein [Herpetosiphonaceae bacterium]|nr:MAG: putative baseplate assembly protein [Herpetosiphonaceae bacterium]